MAASRRAIDTRFGVRWWQVTMPHSRPCCSSEMTIDARTPMLRRYSMWIGDRLRTAEKLRSSGCRVSGSSVGTRAEGTASVSAITRTRLTVYSRRAWGGMSLAGKRMRRKSCACGVRLWAMISPSMLVSKRYTITLS
jgi:hypothetical protein